VKGGNEDEENQQKAENGIVKLAVWLMEKKRMNSNEENENQWQHINNAISAKNKPWRLHVKKKIIGGKMKRHRRRAVSARGATRVCAGREHRRVSLRVSGCESAMVTSHL